MANANNSVIVSAIRGQVGKELVFREWDGKIIVSKYVAPTAKSTPAQAKTRQNFLLASRYAKSVLKNPDQSLAQAYAASLKPRQNLYSRALEDFMSPPVVKQIDTSNYNATVGSIIVVHAMDDFRVTSVRIEFFSREGTLVESGEAIIDTTSLNWVYKCIEPHVLAPGFLIRATATDIPGNTGKLELVI